MNKHPDEMSHRERESAERHHREQYSASTPHHSNAGSLPIHQPVASRISGAIHSPGGLLANHGANTAGAMSGPSGNYGAPMPSDPASRQHPHSAQSASSQMFGAIGGPNQGPPPGAAAAPAPASSGPVFGGPLQQQEANRAAQMPYPGPGPGPNAGPAAGGPPGGPHPAAAAAAIPTPPGAGPQGAANAGGMTQGQQPILNDALSYLDQVKVQFADQPDVYNKFLDIMKDFKSQTIDTPGVINRVSELFAGHPNLIQGFNTFLPPGYRIECGAGNDPNTIRVTTPMGTTVQSITGRANQAEGGHAAGSSVPFYNHRQGPQGAQGSNWQQSQPQHSIESPEATFSVPAENAAGAFAGPGQNQGQGAPFDGPSSASAKRAASQLQGQQQSTPSAPQRAALTPTPTGPAGAPNSGGAAASQQGGTEKRGPVEFNHAISYVNKIKNRFQDKPEIYKQFLEILQTYQREQKPIQDVYAQVTSLFNGAPDLLEDFKQFLPESAASNKGNGARPEDVLGLTGLAQATPQLNQAARDGQKMPPMGNFAPPASASKDNKKRPRNDNKTATIPPMPESPAQAPRSIPGIGTNSKRPKLGHKPVGAESMLIESTLTPVLPEPLAPTSSANATAEEVNFFEKAKKHIGNRAAMNEFLKLCNMYSQSLIDTNELVHKASQFIGGSAELMSYFKNFVAYTGVDDVVENRPRPPTEKVSLSNCRNGGASGPSYRLLPRREKLKPCGGRDEMCNAVLNDEWASHPTWASEDSGFVAHRKNAFEEGLHRIEEERHDYDFNIEANVKCIQLLEPIAQQMLNMAPSERDTFQMPHHLNGPSTSIYKRVLKKIYGAEKGAEVVNEMFSDPFAVVPVVLARLKQKDEEWRFTQREWEKVWQAQTEIMHIKSLDHMGIQVRQSDKRNMSAKHLVDMIKTKHEEQRRSRSPKNRVPQFQFHYDFADQGVVLDVLRLMVVYANTSGHLSNSEKERLSEFYETFVPILFDVSEEKAQERLQDIDRESSEEDTEEQIPAELTNGRTRRNGKKSDLLRGVLDPGRNGTKPRTQKDEGSPGSKETTPDVGSANEEDMPDAAEDAAPSDTANERWLPAVPRATVVKGDNPLLDSEGELKADGFFPRPWYNFFCNQTIYLFFSIFQVLYKRLKDVKDSAKSVAEEIKRGESKLPARELGVNPTHLNFFDKDDPDSFWPRTMELIEEFVLGEVEENRYQEILRHYYLKKGWTLYTVPELLRSLSRSGLSCTGGSDSKDKSPDLVQQFTSSRQQEETSYQTEISARKFAEKCVKDGDLFVICWFPNRREATVKWLQRDETTFHMDEMERRERWQYYISSYMRVEPTEGVPRSRLQKTVLARNLPSGDTESDGGDAPKSLKCDESLNLRICLNSYKIVWEKDTTESFIYATEPESAEERAEQQERANAATEHRNQRFREKFVMNNSWMRGMSQDEVQSANDKFQKWFKDGISPESASGAGNGDEAMEGIE